MALVEAGLIPIAGSFTSTASGEATVESAAFRCQPQTGPAIVVLSTVWRTPRETVRARLQFPENAVAQIAPDIESIRASLRFRAASTPSFAEWRNLSPTTEVAGLRAGAVAPPLPMPEATIPSASSAELGKLVRDFSASLVFIEGAGGVGSGFICRTKDGVALLTNQHVVAGVSRIRFTRTDNAAIETGAISAAVGHDLIRFVTPEIPRPLIASDNVEADAQIGDEIVVLGNSEGARVIQPLSGKLVGIGPDRVEVSAEFLPGNSGSPIIHVKSGKVIGVATFLVRGQFPEFTDSQQARTRRFGYRLDSVKQWQSVRWAAYQTEKAELNKVATLTRDISRLIDDLSGDSKLVTAAHSNPVLSRPVRELSTALSNRTLSPADRNQAVGRFMASMRTITQSDVAAARPALTYDFFRRDLAEHSEVRERMYQLFDNVLKSR